MTKTTEHWPKMIRAVYDSFDTGRHSGDAVARRVMDRTVSWLVAGLELSPRLQARLIDNINMRTAFEVVEPAKPIRLTRNQIDYAKRTNPEWFGLGLEGEDDVAENLLKGADVSATFQSGPIIFQQVFSNLSASIQHSFSSLSALFPHEALALAQDLVSRAAENIGSGATSCLAQTPKVMERKENESNHEPDMTLASPTSSCHENSGADAMDHKPQADEGSGDAQVISHAQAGSEEVGHGVRARRPALTIWVKPNRLGDLQATGYLDRNGTKHALKFTGFDHALERIGNTDAAWHGFVSNEVAPLFLPLERQSTGIASKATMSGLYGQLDTYARKSPTTFNEAIALEWDGEVPLSAFLIEGRQVTEVPLHLEANNRYKGIL